MIAIIILLSTTFSHTKIIANLRAKDNNNKGSNNSCTIANESININLKVCLAPYIYNFTKNMDIGHKFHHVSLHLMPFQNAIDKKLLD